PPTYRIVVPAKAGRRYRRLRRSWHDGTDDMGESMNVSAGPLIGQPVGRAEDRRFLKGAGRFIDDLTRDGMLHAGLPRSGGADGRIRGLDAAEAGAMPGVHAVITAAEIGQTVPVIPLRLANLPEFKPYFQPVIASEKARYVGEPLAVIVADTAA